MAAVETATPELLDLLDPGAKAPLLISGERAAALSLANERDAADPAAPVLIERSEWLDAGTALAIADPGRDLERAPFGPLKPLPLNCSAIGGERRSRWRRLAGLLPALWVVDAADGDRLGRRRRHSEPDSRRSTLVARARLPLEGMPETQIVAFRAPTTAKSMSRW